MFRHGCIKLPGVRFAISSAAIIFIAGAAIAADGEASGDEHSGRQSVSTYAGVDFAKDSRGYFTGATMAFNRDLSQSGFVAKSDGVISEYEYDSGGVVNGDGYQSGLSLGYQWLRDNMAAGLSVGFDYQNEKLSPNDPSTEEKGSEVGVKVGGDLAFSGDRMSIQATGSYSTVFESYWVRGRFAIQCEKFEFGPEAYAFGSESYADRRFGGFATYNFDVRPDMPASVSVSVGHQFVREDSAGADAQRGGGEGTYVTLTTSLAY